MEITRSFRITTVHGPMSAGDYHEGEEVPKTPDGVTQIVAVEEGGVGRLEFTPATWAEAESLIGHGAITVTISA